MKIIEQYEQHLRMKNYAQNTIKCYSNIVLNFIEAFKCEPSLLTENQIKAYIASSSSPALVKQRIGAIKPLYKYILNQPLKFKYIEYPRREQRLPDVLSTDEIKRLFSVITNLKHKAILMIIYSTGMRRQEVIDLKLTDIDSSRMLIKITDAKGHKDRFVRLSDNVLLLLRAYFQKEHPKTYLFNGQFSLQYSATSIVEIFKKYARMAGIRKRVHPHMLRHTNATHLLENGTDLRYIANLLGHASTRTTERYTHVANTMISKIVTPDMLFV
jgi:integrase/recombinase XerD